MVAVATDFRSSRNQAWVSLREVTLYDKDSRQREDCSTVTNSVPSHCHYLYNCCYSNGWSLEMLISYQNRVSFHILDLWIKRAFWVWWLGGVFVFQYGIYNRRMKLQHIMPQVIRSNIICTCINHINFQSGIGMYWIFISS